MLIKNDRQKYPHIEITCAVTDNAANMITTCTKLQLKHMGCFMHTLQLVIRTAMRKDLDIELTIDAFPEYYFN